MSNPRGEVLIADADTSIRSLLATICARNDLRPVEAADGRSALQLLQSLPFRAILLELLLPEISGLDIVAYIAGERPELLPQVIVITGMAEWKRNGHVLRTRAVLVKPFDVEELQRTLLACCDGGPLRPPR